jgi:hypothetical protein
MGGADHVTCEWDRDGLRGETCGRWQRTAAQGSGVGRGRGGGGQARGAGQWRRVARGAWRGGGAASNVPPRAARHLPSQLHCPTLPWAMVGAAGHWFGALCGRLWRRRGRIHAWRGARLGLGRGRSSLSIAPGDVGQWTRASDRATSLRGEAITMDGKGPRQIRAAATRRNRGCGARHATPIVRPVRGPGRRRRNSQRGPGRRRRNPVGVLDPCAGTRCADPPATRLARFGPDAPN